MTTTRSSTRSDTWPTADQRAVHVRQTATARRALLLELFQKHKPDAVAHLAAMAAVRYSVEHPLLYGRSTVQDVNVLDAARQTTRRGACWRGREQLRGGNAGAVQGGRGRDRPLAPYPASKRAMEVFAHSYAHLWKLPTTLPAVLQRLRPARPPGHDAVEWAMQIHRAGRSALYNTRLSRCRHEMSRGFVAAAVAIGPPR